LAYWRVVHPRDKENLDLKAPPVAMAKTALKAPRATLARLVPQDPLGLEVRLAMLVFRDRLALSAPKVLLVLLVRRGQLVFRVLKASKVFREPPAPLVRLALKALLA